jgi:tRNA pseudouridine13 synthase
VVQPSALAFGVRSSAARFVARLGFRTMKLKRQPEDFQVEELPLVAGGGRGRFTFYRLTKRGLGTLEAIEAISRRWNLAGRRISYGGLKDRHAVTIQYLTIFDGPPRALHESSFDLESQGRITHPYGPAHFRGNRFVVILRDLSAEALMRAERALGALPRDGLPNYFDDQRFGSVGFGGGFIAQAWLAGDAERALRLAIAEPNPSDRPSTKAEKVILREFWGRWPEAKARLERSHARSLVTYLVDHPTDFRGAFARVRRELRSLYFSAFQSHLWNLMLARSIERLTRPDQRVLINFKAAALPIHRGLDPDQAETLAALRLPLPSARTLLPDDDPISAVAREILEPFGLAWTDLRVRHLQDVFFSKGLRPAVFHAENLAHEPGNDEFQPGRKRLRLAFELPKGAYATLVVKRVTEAAS